MVEELAAIGRKMAKEFINTNQDVFVMIADVDGKEVSVCVNFAPPTPKVSKEDVWNMLAERVSNQRLT